MVSGRRHSRCGLEGVFDLLGLESGMPERKPTVLHLITALVQIRNKTRAHGAAGEDFWTAANQPYASVVNSFVSSCPLFQWKWIHLEQRANGGVRGVWLRGTNSTHALKKELSILAVERPGVFLWPDAATDPIPCGPLLRGNRECTEFLLPNGGFSAAGNARFMDYAAGKESSVDASKYIEPPVPLPPSDTHGHETLVVQSNTLGNRPALSDAYVTRPELERELKQRLSDRNHPIITLHGSGGIGKTSLALAVAQELARQATPVFDEILWFSARDVDLDLHGPRSVRPAVVTLKAVAEQYGRLMGADTTEHALAEALQDADKLTGKGVLFVFDNFETMADIRQMHEFLDTHTHLPNKVLITSRERAFKADFPIVVLGMEAPEAHSLLKSAAVAQGSDAILTDEVANRIFEYAEGHPYIMKILVGELAKERRFVAPKTLMPRRSDVLDAVFQRSFVALSDAARWVFLLTTNWNSAIAETGLLVVLASRGLSAEDGIEECIRLSLINRLEFSDQRSAFFAPQVARVFGRKKLTGDPDRLLVKEDLETVQKFGVLPTGDPIRIPEDVVLARFAEWAVKRAKEAPDGSARVAQSLAFLAELWPPAWLSLAEVRIRTGDSDEGVEYALRRAVEENPTDPRSWEARARYAKRQGDDGVAVASHIRRAELEPDDVGVVLHVAGEVVRFVSDHKEIPVARRNVYLASVRELMLRLSDDLDASGLSRLAWLFLTEGNSPEAWRWAAQGLKEEPANEHCRALVERLKEAGYYGPDSA